MLTKDQKKEVVKNLREKLAKNKLGVFCNFEGLSVEKQRQLKKEFKQAGGELFVVKRRLLKKALEEEKVNVPEITGSIMVGLADDEILPAKIINSFPKDKKEKIEFVGGVANEKNAFTFLSIDDVKDIATLPSREELLAKLIGTIRAPIANLNYVLIGNIQKLAYIFSNIKTS
jgi:large subunit ribosomal protein L10